MATKLVRKAGQKSLKSQGAGYSTTNKKGETSFYKSGNDAPGYTDNAKGKAPISKFDASGTAITPESLNKTDVATLPTPPTTPNIGDVVGANNTGLATMLSPQGYTQDAKGMFVAPKEDAGSSNDMSGLVNAFNSYLGASDANAPVNQESIYNKTLKQSGVNDAQKQVNQYTSQLNSIVAKSQAEQLGLEGQGRGVTESIIGGQQAQINREAAIAALPVQAQLAAAQGNLEFAQKQMDTLFNLRVADATAKYNYKSNLISSVYNFATTIEQSRLNALKTKEDRAYSEKQQSIADAKNLAQQAMDNGQFSLASRLMNLDQNSPSYSKEVSSAITELRKPTSPVKRDTQVVGNQLIDMQTGEVISNVAGVGNEFGTINGKAQNATQSTVNGYANRLLEAERVLSVVNNQFAGGTAYGNLLPNVLQSAERQQFEQAKRNFVNAVLRRESGAVISPSEFQNAAIQYFAQPGDKEETLLQKAANRNTVINNLFNEANVYRPVAPGDIIVSEGVRYEVGDDGVSITPIE